MANQQRDTIKVIPGGIRSEQKRELEFARLYQESYGIVYGYVRLRVQDEATAEDIVSEAFLKAARSFSSFDPARAKFTTWVIKIATNCMNDYWRQARPTTDIEDVPESFLSITDDTDQIANRAVIKSLLSVLDETEKQLVLMKYLLGYRNVDIAQELNMNASTISTKLAHALEKMREKAEKEAVI